MSETRKVSKVLSESGLKSDVTSPRPARAACDGVLQRADAVEHVEEHLADEDDGEEREHRDGEDRLGVHDLLQ